MSKQSDILERERSARKKAEIDAEVNTNKEIVYNYVAARKDVLGSACVEELQFFAKGKAYLEWLALRGHLTRVKKTVNGARQYVYNAAIPYVKPVSDIPDVATTNADKLVQSVTRVFKLMDREKQEPMTKAQREKARSSSIGNMQSSMNMFGSW
jgi:hypothetical protein